MDKNEVGERFRNLAIGSANRPEAARLRDIFDEVEVALKARVPQLEVLAELHKLGFEMKIGAFKSALQRIRKERTVEGEAPARTPKTPLRNSTEMAPAAAAPGKQQNSGIAPQPNSNKVERKTVGVSVDRLKEIAQGPFDPNQFNDDE